MHGWQRHHGAIVLSRQLTGVQLDGIIVARWRVRNCLIVRWLLSGATRWFLDGDYVNRIVYLQRRESSFESINRRLARETRNGGRRRGIKMTMIRCKIPSWLEASINVRLSNVAPLVRIRCYRVNTLRPRCTTDRKDINPEMVILLYIPRLVYRYPPTCSPRHSLETL